MLDNKVGSSYFSSTYNYHHLEIYYSLRVKLGYKAYLLTVPRGIVQIQSDPIILGQCSFTNMGQTMELSEKARTRYK